MKYDGLWMTDEEVRRAALSGDPKWQARAAALEPEPVSEITVAQKVYFFEVMVKHAEQYPLSFSIDRTEYGAPIKIHFLNDDHPVFAVPPMPADWQPSPLTQRYLRGARANS